jgi:hypothetical protein
MESFLNSITYLPENPPVSALYMIDNKGRDWYEAQKYFLETTMKIMTTSMIDPSIILKSYDVSALVPRAGQCIYEVDISKCPRDFLYNELLMDTWAFSFDKVVRIKKDPLHTEE